MTIYPARRAPLALLACAVIGSPAAAQEENSEKRRTRIGVGAQVVPSYPGADAFSVRPLVDIARARGDTPFEFEAPDESFDIALLNRGGFAMGPALGFEGSRKASDVGAPLPKVGFTLEAGMFMQYALSKTVRLRAEVRKGIGGHEGLIANLSADFIKRKNDDWLFSIGPRVTIADRKYHRAYYSLTPADAAPSGLPAYSAGAGIQAVGATAGYLAQLTRRWGVYSYLKYDRLVADAAGSPIVRRHGSRDQWSGGLALTYTFGAD
jgi:outer membrane protein